MKPSFYLPLILPLIAVAGCAADPAELAEPAIVFMGASCGNGVFNPDELCVTNPGTQVLTTNEQVVTVLAVDVNNDTFRDLVAATASRIWIRYGTAAGFGAQVSLFTAGASYTDVAAADFDGDNDLDIAATDAGTDRVIVWRNTGAVFPMLWDQINVGDNPVRILSRRINGDVRADVVAFSMGSHEATVLLADGSPFGVPMAYMVGNAQDIALGDCDGDSRLDLLYATGFGAIGHINARPNVGFGNFGVPIVSSLPLVDAVHGPLQHFAIAAGDFDNDLIDDAVVSASFSRLAPATSDGDCTFSTSYTPFTMNTTWAWVRARLRIVDWNADGNLDLGAPHGLAGGLGDEVYTIPLGTGAATFPSYGEEHHAPDTVIPKDLAFYDASGDGHMDVLVAASTGVILERRIP